MKKVSKLLFQLFVKKVKKDMIMDLLLKEVILKKKIFLKKKKFL